MVTPPYVARPAAADAVPRRCGSHPRRIGDPASARAFARPYRGVAAAPRAVAASAASSTATTSRRSTSTSTPTRRPHRPRPGRRPRPRAARPARDEAPVFPHEGVHPAQADELADRMAQMALNPAPILLVHRGPAAVRELAARSATGRPTDEFVDRAGQQHRVWAIRDRRPLAAPGRRLGRRPAARRRRPPPLRRLRCALQHRRPAPATDRGLAMLVDHDDTPLFLGADPPDPARASRSTTSPARREAAARVERVDQPDAVAALARHARRSPTATTGRRPAARAARTAPPSRCCTRR